MQNYLMIFLGGGVGSILRFSIYQVVNFLGLGVWPATLVVNVLGSLVIISLNSFIEDLPNYQNSFLKVGLLGGLTTFSSLALDAFTFAKSGDYLQAFGIILLNIIMGIVVGIFLFK